MAKSKFKGKVQNRPKLNSYTLVVSDGVVEFLQVKAIDVEGAKALYPSSIPIQAVVKGHPEVVEVQR